MQETVGPLLTGWANFYVIIGSSAAALTGLLFIVITLVAGSGVTRGGGAIAAFNTPNVVHFCAAFLIAVILSAPWPMLWNTSLLLGLMGLAGMGYIVVVLRRTRRQTDYELVLEDWLWHTIFPFISYTALVVAAIVLPGNPVPTLFVIGAATVLFLFIGIHNSWDNVIYIVFDRPKTENKGQDQEKV